MAKLPSVGTRVYLDEFHLSGSLTAADMSVNQELPDVTCFGNVGPRRVVGSYSHAHTVRGLFEGGSTQIDAVTDLVRNNTDRSTHYLTELFSGSAEGSVCYESIVHVASEPIKAAVANAVALELSFDGAGGQYRGRVLANASGLNSTLSLLTSIDEGVGSTNGVYAATFRAIGGTFTNCVLKIQDSSNNSTWGDSTGLTATFTQANVSQAQSTAILKQYKRVACSTFTGTSQVEILVTGGIIAGSLTPQT